MEVCRYSTRQIQSTELLWGPGQPSLDIEGGKSKEVSDMALERVVETDGC